jgi:CNT family concentrative nucleoside transporter
MAAIAHGLLGLAMILGLAWCVSEHRRRIPLRTVFGGIALQIALAVLLLRFPPATRVFFLLDDAVNALQKATDAGTGFVFGYLGGGPAPFQVTNPASSFILAFRALPLVLVIGALASLLVRPYLAKMSRGELFALMTCGMAGIAGTMMVIYTSILGPIIPNALGFILIASVISTPAGLAVAAIMIPFEAAGSPSAQLVTDDPATGAMDAIVRGTAAGVRLLINIIAMLVVLVALTSLVNLAQLPPGSLSPRSQLMLITALCGFANLGSVGIIIGGMGAMIPERRSEVASLGVRSLFSGTAATCMSAAVVGMLLTR